MSRGISQPTMIDAFKYLEAVEITLGDDKDKFKQFVDVLNRFFNNRQRQTAEEVIARAKELFKDHIGLLFGLNVFLPFGFQIKLPLEDAQQQSPLNPRVTTEQARNFLNMIRMTQFEDGNAVYHSIIDILKLYKRGTKPVAEAYWEIVMLFKGHNELINEFNKFVPINAYDPVMLLADVISRE